MIKFDATSGLQYPDETIQDAMAAPQPFKNRIINGGMQIDQRYSGASTTIPLNGLYTLDRWFCWATQESKYTVQQNAGAVTPPPGFSNYLGVVSSSAYTVLSTDQFFIQQRIEGLNCMDLGWGTAAAYPVTLSFWVRSSLTGDFGGVIKNSSNARSYPFSYTISSANTWTFVTITIPGDTTGTWLITSGAGLKLGFSLGVGSDFHGPVNTWNAANDDSPASMVSVVGTNGATWYITGVQLEAGSVATSFEKKFYEMDLLACLRYFQSFRTILVAWGGNIANYGGAVMSTQLPVEMRGTPTVLPIVSTASGSGWTGSTTTLSVTGTGIRIKIWSPVTQTTVGAYNQINVPLSAEL